MQRSQPGSLKTLSNASYKKKSTFTQRYGRSVLLKLGRRANSFWLLKSSAGWKALSTVIISSNPNPSSRNGIKIVGKLQSNLWHMESNNRKVCPGGEGFIGSIKVAEVTAYTASEFPPMAFEEDDCCIQSTSDDANMRQDGPLLLKSKIPVE
ncbi:unnamed protein product [Calypogeia fissa]